MSPIDPGFEPRPEDHSFREREDRGQLEAERAYRHQRGYGDHGDPTDAASLRIATLSAPGVHRPRSGGRSRWILVAVALVVLGVVGAGAFFFLNQPVTVEIGEGDDAIAIANKLNQANDALNPGEVQALLEGPGPGIVPGTYELNPDLGTVDQVRALQAEWVDADPGITFPEGFTVAKIAARIAANRWQYTDDGLVSASEALTVDPRVQRPAEITSAEGLLFPSTYSIGSDLEPSKTMGQMLVSMQGILFDELDAEAASLNFLRTPYEMLIIASLIEKEAKTDNDRALISRVIHNRLERGMKLQIDASLYYNAPGDADFAELREADSPYNLYLYEGLPPTPIANPGRASLEAAFNPAPPLDPSDGRCAAVSDEECALLFYVLADAEGNHAFSVTFEQHEANIEAAKEAGVL